MKDSITWECTKVVVLIWAAEKSETYIEIRVQFIWGMIPESDCERMWGIRYEMEKCFIVAMN